MPEKEVDREPSVKSIDLEPKKLNERHRIAIMMMVYEPKYTKKEIAEKLEFDYNSFSAISRSPLFQKELQKEARKRDKAIRETLLEKVANKSVKVLDEALSKGKIKFQDHEKGEETVIRLSGRVLMETVRDVLDRTGHKPVDRKVEAHFDFGENVRNAFDEDGEGSGKDDDEVVDVEWREVVEEGFTEKGGTARKAREALDEKVKEKKEKKLEERDKDDVGKAGESEEEIEGFNEIKESNYTTNYVDFHGNVRENESPASDPASDPLPSDPPTSNSSGAPVAGEENE